MTTIVRGFYVFLGSLIAAAGLQIFLLPNNLIDGGVVGISIISAELTTLPLGFFLVALNAPFVWLGYRKLGKPFALYSTFGIISLAVMTTLFHFELGLTYQPILAAIFGGLLVGLGVGLVIRFGGTLDGTDTVAILIDRRSSFSIGEIVMFINVFIVGASGFVFGWDSALYSMVAYYIAHKTIDVAVEGFNESRGVWIISHRHAEIAEQIQQQLGRKITYINYGSKRGEGTNRGVILSIITRLEEQQIKQVIHSVDPKAFVVISHTHDVIGHHSLNEIH